MTLRLIMIDGHSLWIKGFCVKQVWLPHPDFESPIMIVYFILLQLVTGLCSFLLFECASEQSQVKKL